jgi:transcriptional regulator with XRE-family HTH domain
MPRFSHDDPEYEAGLREMSLRLNRLMDDRGWSRADLTRAASKFMPEGGRFGPDNTSNFVNGKRRPTKPFVIAMCKAFGVEEDAFLPPYLLDRPGEAATSRPPSLTLVPGKPHLCRVFIDLELPIKQGVKIFEALGHENEDDRPS